MPTTIDIDDAWMLPPQSRVFARTQTPSSIAGTHSSAGQLLQLSFIKTRLPALSTLAASPILRINKEPFVYWLPFTSPATVACRKILTGATRDLFAASAADSVCRRFASE